MLYKLRLSCVYKGALDAAENNMDPSANLLLDPSEKKKEMYDFPKPAKFLGGVGFLAVLVLMILPLVQPFDNAGELHTLQIIILVSHCLCGLLTLVREYARCSITFAPSDDMAGGRVSLQGEKVVVEHPCDRHRPRSHSLSNGDNSDAGVGGAQRKMDHRRRHKRTTSICQFHNGASLKSRRLRQPHC